MGGVFLEVEIFTAGCPVGLGGEECGDSGERWQCLGCGVALRGCDPVGGEVSVFSDGAFPHFEHFEDGHCTAGVALVEFDHCEFWVACVEVDGWFAAVAGCACSCAGFWWDGCCCLLCVVVDVGEELSDPFGAVVADVACLECGGSVALWAQDAGVWVAGDH